MSDDRYRAALATARSTHSWVSDATAVWERLADTASPTPDLGFIVEEQRGAPPTPGWD